MKPKNINHGSTNQGTEQATNEVNADLNESEESKPLDELKKKWLLSFISQPLFLFL